MIIYVFAAALMLIGASAAMLRNSLIKKIVGLAIMTNGIHLFLIRIGYKAGGVMPIRTSTDPLFLSLAVDPIPQALVLTSIVIDLSVLGLAVALCILLNKKTGTMDSDKIKELQG